MNSKTKKSDKVDWDTVGYILSSEVRFDILKLLEKHMLTPTQIKNELRLSITHISNELRSLRKRGLLECVNPDAKKGRIYNLTELGKAIYEITLRIKTE